MKILHLSQAIDSKRLYGGAEHEEILVLKHALKDPENEVISMNASGIIYRWKAGVASRMNYDGFFAVETWCDAVWLSNIEWFPPELLVPLLNRVAGKKPIFYFPRHFTPCVYTGLPDTTENLCKSQCRGLFSCRESFRWLFYKWLLNISNKVVVASPLLAKTFVEAFKDELDGTEFVVCPSPIDETVFHNLGVDRIMDAVSVGGGTIQKGLENHIKWAKDRPDRSLTIYGNLQCDPQSLPSNVSYGGTVDNQSLPSVLNLYKTFVYYPKCDEAYGRTVAEAAMCGCELDVDEERVGAMYYGEPIVKHQKGSLEKYWEIIQPEEPKEVGGISSEYYKVATPLIRLNPNMSEENISTAIIMSAHNHFEYTMRCLDSLNDSILPKKHLVVFINDGSTDDTKKMRLKKFRKEHWPNLNFNVIQHKEAVNCTASWNEGIRVASQQHDFDYYAVVNNDTLFPTNWLKTLIEDSLVFNADIVGPLSNCPGNRPAQEVDRALFYELSDDLLEINKIQNILENRVDIPIETSAVNGFCMLIPRSTLFTMRDKDRNLFDPTIESFGNEDKLQSDMRKAGLKAFISRRSFVFHYENITFEDRSSRGKARANSLSIRAKGTGESLKTLTDRLDKSDMVYYTRFGDGEIAMFNGSGLDTRNINEMEATQEFRDELTESFLIDSEDYLRAVSVNYPRDDGMVDGLFAPFPYNEELLRAVNNVDTTELEGDVRIYENPVLFHYLAVFKSAVYTEFLDKYVRPKTKMFVGSQPKEQMERMFGEIKCHVITPKQNSYSDIEDIWESIKINVKACKIDMVILATGQTSNIIQKRMWNAGMRVHCIDVGSVVDAIVEENSRDWIILAGDKVKKCLLK